MQTEMYHGDLAYSVPGVASGDDYDNYGDKDGGDDDGEDDR